MARLKASLFQGLISANLGMPCALYKAKEIAMNKKQFIVTLILIFALGAVFESFKKVNFRSQSGDGGVSALLSDLSMKPFAQNFRDGKLGKSKKVTHRARMKKRPRANEPMETLEQMAKNQKGQFSFNENPQGKKVADNSKNDSDTNKESDKGDKKEEGEGDEEKAKNPDGDEDADKKEVADIEDELKKDGPENKPDDDVNEDSAAEATPFSGRAPVVSQNEDGDPKPLNELLAEWANELLKFPDYKLMNEFIAQKQAGQIPDEVFYPIISMMLEDSRESMKVLGAHGLGATPSAKSFELIVSTKSSAPFGSRLSQDLSSHAQTYASLQFLSALKDVLYSSEDLETIRTAAILVDQAATNYLPKSQHPPESEISALETQRKQQLDIFEGFKSILSSLSQSSSDQGVVAAATQALAHIKEHIPDKSDDDVSVVSNQ